MTAFFGGTGLARGFAIVVDVGKTLSKISLWSRDGRLLDRQVRANAAPEMGAARRLDAAAIGEWLVAALKTYAGHPIEYLVPVGHGAGVAAIAGDRLAFPPLDYEQPLPPDVLAAYRAERDAFALTGSPALPAGLNLGAQLFWLDRLHPAAAQTTLMPWAQYWAWFLAGVATSEVSSLGCHSDLWLPGAARFAPLAERMGWAARFAPLVPAGATIGPLRPALAAQTGLPPAARVLAGAHDSNAALLAARGLAAIGEGEATVLSTGTWFVAMRLGEAAGAATPASLPAARDCLINVDIAGRAVPSARFMGGREIAAAIGADPRPIDLPADQPALLGAVAGVLDGGAMLLPTLAPGCGPFPAHTARWIAAPADAGARRAAIGLYAALVADAALDLIGARHLLLIEGRFARAEVFTRALAALRPDMRVCTADADTDVSFGALRLIDPQLRPEGGMRRVPPLPGDLGAYRARWRAALHPPA